MQIAVLADIHGNLPALEAVAADIEHLNPDLVFVAGDFQNRGPNPLEVTKFVAQRSVIKRMRQRFRLREITVVAGRGMVSQATLEAFEQSDPPVRYIVGVRMRRQKEVNTSVLGSRARWFESVPERSHAKDPAPLKVKEVWVQ